MRQFLKRISFLKLSQVCGEYKVEQREDVYQSRNYLPAENKSTVCLKILNAGYLLCNQFKNSVKEAVAKPCGN